MAFRELARIKQRLTDEQCAEVLESELRGVLAVNGDDGYPYCLPINFYYNPEDGRVYSHSSKKGYKNDCIARDGRACFTVMRDAGPIPGSDWARLVDSVIIYGRMELVEHGEFHEEMTRRLSYRFTDDSDYIEGEIAKLAKATAVFALVPEHVRGKRVKEE